MVHTEDAVCLAARDDSGSAVAGAILAVSHYKKWKDHGVL